MSKSAGAAPQPPKFRPINIPATENLSTQADIQGYNLSDTDLATRFPGLVTGRGQQVEDAYKQLTGLLDPTVQHSFVNQGLAQSLNAFGGGNPAGGSVKPGEASGNAVATSLANNVQKKQDYDRSNFEQQLGVNPQRAFGLTGSDVANMTVANVVGQNNYLQARYGGNVSTSNAQSAANAQQQAAAAAITAQIVSAIISASDERLKENIVEVGTWGETPIKEFNFKADPRKTRHIGFVAQDLERVQPWAVSADHLGFKVVHYGRVI